MQQPSLQQPSLQQPFTSVDLQAYAQRIGCPVDQLLADSLPTLQTLQTLHRLHAQAIAFENLNGLLRQPVRLDLPALQEKLILGGRGGYCFEQNLLLRSVLVAIGFTVKNLAARVLWNLPEGNITPRSHMLLLVTIDKQDYIADVGFGGMTLTAPLRLIVDIEQPTPHEPFRLVAVEDTYQLQVRLDRSWKSLYAFDLQAQQLPDYEVSSWYLSNHPDSLFVNHLIAARPDANCRYSLRDNLFSIHALNGATEKHLLHKVSELRHVLEDAFRLNLAAIAPAENCEAADSLESVLQRIIDQNS